MVRSKFQTHHTNGDPSRPGKCVLSACKPFFIRSFSVKDPVGKLLSQFHIKMKSDVNYLSSYAIHAKYFLNELQVFLLKSQPFPRMLSIGNAGSQALPRLMHQHLHFNKCVKLWAILPETTPEAWIILP